MMHERYVAFLRAINVGGHRVMRMAELRRELTEAGFGNVATYIASGNVLFTCPLTDRAEVTRAVERLIASRLHLDVEVMLRTHDAVLAMVARDPFGHVTLGKTITGYVTLLYHPPDDALSRAIESLSNDVEVLRVHGSEIFTTCFRERGKAEQLTSLEKKLRIVGTTRNWNTILKLATM
jgi:uncharacterized protein (DUF1697 family)